MNGNLGIGLGLMFILGLSLQHILAQTVLCHTIILHILKLENKKTQLDVNCGKIVLFIYLYYCNFHHH
jgi:hypothetical protein